MVFLCVNCVDSRLFSAKTGCAGTRDVKKVNRAIMQRHLFSQRECLCVILACLNKVFAAFFMVLNAPFMVVLTFTYYEKSGFTECCFCTCLYLIAYLRLQENTDQNVISCYYHKISAFLQGTAVDEAQNCTYPQIAGCY